MLNFKQFIERQDVPTMEALKQSAHQAFENLVSFYKQYEKSFRKRRAREDRHDYVMELGGIITDRIYTPPSIGSYRITIHRTGQGVMSKLGKLSGELRGSTIILYDETISDLIRKLNELADMFRWRSIQNETPKAGSIRKQANEIILSLLKELENKKEVFLDILYHEIVHATRHGSVPDPTLKPGWTLGDLQNAYVNNPAETDAYFLTKANRLLQDKQYSSFPEFLNDFKESIPQWEVINDKIKKKMIARLYQLFSSKI